MATNPDVRVRLSAEGVQEVVNALKQIQSQSQKTAAGAKSVGGGFEAAAKGVAALQAAMAPLAALFATLGGISFAKGLVDSAEQLGRASKQTGIAVEALSRLAYAANTVRVNSEELFDALSDFSEKMFDAAAGSGDGADALKAMGFSADYAKKNINNLPKILGDVADKLSTYKDGAAKTTLLIKLFGDAGKNLLPLLDQGAEGLRKLGIESDNLGATLNEEAVAEAIRFNTELSKLTASAKAFAQTLLGPVLGAVNGFINRMKKAKEESGSLRFVEAAFKGVGYRDTIDEAEADVARLEKLLADSGKIDPEGEMFLRLQRARSNRAELIKQKAETDKLLAEGKKGDQRNAAPDLSLGKDAEDRAKAAQARLEAVAAAKDQELALLRLKNTMADEEQKASYDQALTTLDKYHADRLARIKAEADQELAAANAKLAAAKAAPLADNATDADKIKKDTAIAAAEAAVEQVKEQARQRRMAEERAQLAEVKAMAEERRAVELQQMEAAGQRSAVAQANLAIEIEKYEQLLQKMGEAKDRIEKLTNAERKRGQGRIDFESAKEAGTNKLNGLDAEKAAVERAYNTGQLWGFEAEAKILEIEKARIPVLRKMAEEMAAAAANSADPALIEQARQASIAVADAEAKTNTYGQALKDLKDTGFNAAVDGFSTFVSDILSGNADISDSFRNMALSVVQALQQMLIKMLAVKAMEAAFGMMGLSPSAGAAVGAAVAKADGGFIAGPGTGTSDSIPAWLSNGEYVIRASSVQAVGIDALNEINRLGRLPRMTNRVAVGSVQKYADGGLVGSVEGNQGGGASSLTVGLDDGLVLKKLQSPAGQKLILEAIGQQRRAVRQLIN